MVSLRLYSIMNSEETRSYHGNDAVMLETAHTLHKLMTENLIDFTAFDSQLNAAFAANWLSSIKAAGSVVRDSQIKDILAQKTMEVHAQMALCILKYNEVKYFATKVFPQNKTIQAEFGRGTFNIARSARSRMIVFMDTLHKTCLKYQAPLLAGGYTQTQIDEILTLRVALQDANTTKENYAKGRPVLTQARIETLNTAYQAMRTVIDAAKVMYYHDYARRNQFTFYEERHKKQLRFALKVV